MARPAQDPNTTTKTRSKSALKPPSMWKVILHNDDYTTQDFVVWILTSVFQKPEAEAVRIMLDVHRRGQGLAGVYPHEIAETKVAQATAMAEQQEFPLRLTMEIA